MKESLWSVCLQSFLPKSSFPWHLSWWFGFATFQGRTFFFVLPRVCICFCGLFALDCYFLQLHQLHIFSSVNLSLDPISLKTTTSVHETDIWDKDNRTSPLGVTLLQYVIVFGSDLSVWHENYGPFFFVHWNICKLVNLVWELLQKLRIVKNAKWRALLATFQRTWWLTWCF